MPAKDAGQQLAYVYAAALYSAAAEMGVLDQVEEDLLALQQTFQRFPRLALFLDSPVIRFEDKCRVVCSLVQLAQPGRNFLRVLVRRQRVELFDQIVAAYREHCNRLAGVAEMDVDSASELAPGELARLKAALESAIERKVVLRPRVQPALLGGMVVRHGGRVYDASLAHHLDRLMGQLATVRSGLKFYADE